MNPKKSYAEYLKDWRHLLSQFAADTTALAGTTAEQRQAALATLVVRIDQLMQQQSERDAAKQTASEEIRLLFVEGRELARDIKLELRGSLGARSMGLVKYKLSPLRINRPSPKKAPEAEPQGEVDGGQQPGASTPVAGPAANGALSPSKA